MENLQCQRNRRKVELFNSKSYCKVSPPSRLDRIVKMIVSKIMENLQFQRHRRKVELFNSKSYCKVSPPSRLDKIGKIVVSKIMENLQFKRKCRKVELLIARLKQIRWHRSGDIHCSQSRQKHEALIHRPETEALTLVAPNPLQMLH